MLIYSCVNGAFSPIYALSRTNLRNFKTVSKVHPCASRDPLCSVLLLINMRIKSIKYTFSVLFLAGLGLFIGLIAYQGIEPVLSALTVAGWGLLAVSMFHWLPLASETVAWRLLFERSHRPAFRTAFWARWIGESADTLLPVAHVGGDLLKGRLLVWSGLPGTLVGATIVVDITLTIVTQILFTLIGLALLAYVLGDNKTLFGIIAGTALTGLLVVGFYLMQRRGLFGTLARLLEKLAAGRDWLHLVGTGDALDAAVVRLYKEPRRVVNSALWLFLTWLIGAGEVWLALYFLGHPIDWPQAVFIESLIQALRTMVFILPAAVGVQEGGFVVLGGLVGIEPHMTLALALMRRVRELFWGVPGLLAWQISEAQRLRKQPYNARTPRRYTKGPFISG
jgi:putative membrane protein